jgi:excisionase family DNA binding protein
MHTPKHRERQQPAEALAQALVSEGLVSVPQAHAFLGVGRGKLYQLMREGELAYVYIGRRRLVPRRALIEVAARGLRQVETG